MASEDQPAKKRFKKAQKQTSVSKQDKVTEEEKAKQEAKKAKKEENLKAEKKRNAEIAAKIAQATKRISSQNQQSSGNLLQSTETEQEGNNIHTLSLPAFREQQSSITFNATVTSSTKQATVRRIKQKKSQTPKSPPPSQIQIHQASGPHHQGGSNSHPLTLPAFRKQLSPSTGDPASTSKKKQPVKRKQQPLANSSSSHQPPDKELSDHQEDDNIDLSPPPTAADPATSRKKQNGTRKKKAAQRPPTSLSTPTTYSDKSTKKQITHVLSDGEDDYNENALITTSCNNVDCKALLLENKTLKETVKKLQRRLDIAGKEL